MNKKSTTVPLNPEHPGCIMIIAKTLAIATVAVLLGVTITKLLTRPHKMDKKISNNLHITPDQLKTISLAMEKAK